MHLPPLHSDCHWLAWHQVCSIVRHPKIRIEMSAIRNSYIILAYIMEISVFLSGCVESEANVTP